MKKILAILVFTFAFTATVSAQEDKKPLSGPQQSKADAVFLKDYLGMSDANVYDLYTLFEMKREILDNPASTIQKKQEIVKTIGMKIQSSLDSKQLEMLLANPELYKKVISEIGFSAGNLTEAKK
jgi:hypothetical protein